ncbi:hypothetical protein AtEden1_Chr1g0054361 [Arabidopsis thaliana]
MQDHKTKNIRFACALKQWGTEETTLVLCVKAEEPLRLNQSRLQDKLGDYCRGACRGEEPRRIQKETRLKPLFSI